MKKTALLLCIAAFSSGCATIKPSVPFSQDFWNEKDKTVAIVVEQLPEPDYLTQGQQGLLDLAINEGANSTLNDYLHELDISEFQGIADEFRTLFESQGLSVVTQEVDAKLPDLRGFNGGGGTNPFADYDYRPLKSKFQADRLLLIKVLRAGVVRPYYGFIPTGEPLANFVVEGRVIDLETNRLLWRVHFDEKLGIQEPWDEPPSFPNVTTAFFKTMELARVKLRDDVRIQPEPELAARKESNHAESSN